jgi:ribose 5-phosphate isomerase A
MGQMKSVVISKGSKAAALPFFLKKSLLLILMRCIWIVDESKLVEKLGAFALPVEVIPYGSQQLYRLFEKKGFAPSFRKNENGDTLTTDGGHYIIDLHLEVIEDPRALGTYLDQLVGVVEHGLFLDMVNKVIVGHEEGPETLNSPHNPSLPH